MLGKYKSFLLTFSAGEGVTETAGKLFLRIAPKIDLADEGSQREHCL